VTLRNQANGEEGRGSSEADGEFSFTILSGGDEKVIRLFEAPSNFVHTYNGLNQGVQGQRVPRLVE